MLILLSLFPILVSYVEALAFHIDRKYSPSETMSYGFQKSHSNWLTLTFKNTSYIDLNLET